MDQTFFRILTFLLIALSGNAILCAQPGNQILKISTLCKPSSVSGWDGELHIRVTLSRDYHINSNKPTMDFLIPTQVQMQSATGFVFAPPMYPKGQDKRFAFADQPISVYEGSATIKVPYRILTKDPRKKWLALGVLSYQGCTEKACFPPRQESFQSELVVYAKKS